MITIEPLLSHGIFWQCFLLSFLFFNVLLLSMKDEEGLRFHLKYIFKKNQEISTRVNN